MKSPLALAALGLLVSAGCGWHAGLAAPEGAETVGVDWFALDEDILERDLEPALQDALSQAVSDLVSLRLVSPTEADVVIRGRVLDYQRRGGIRGEEHQMLETGVTIAVEARLERRASGEVLGSARAALPRGYITANRTGEQTYEVGGARAEDRARAQLLRTLAEGLVLDLFSGHAGP